MCIVAHLTCQLATPAKPGTRFASVGRVSGRILTILNVAYPFAPVGPDAVGGAEQILTRIDEALVAAGHRSLVIASEGSSVAGQLIPIPRFGGRLTPALRAAANRATRHALQAALRRSAVDLVHFHGLDFAAQLPPIGPPVLITLHLPVHAYPPSVFQIDRAAGADGFNSRKNAWDSTT
jgi:Glycosyltransferase Family 4